MELLTALAAHAGIFFAALGLLLNAYATLKNIKSRKLLNYQEIVKSHRDIWKLVLDKPGTYSRVLEVDPDLGTVPISSEERRFVNLLLLHMTSAFYFAKESDIVKIQQLRADARGVMSLPIPRRVWAESSHYFNKDFVSLIEGSRIDTTWRRITGRRSIAKCTPVKWNILLLTSFTEKLLPIVDHFGDQVIAMNDPNFPLTTAFLKDHEIDLIICFGYEQTVDVPVLRRATAIKINLGYLPYGRGVDPNLWAILDGDPRGVTIHYVDKGTDTGDIIAQREVSLPIDTSATLMSTLDQLVDAGISLFKSTWPEIRAGRSKRTAQTGTGTYHGPSSLRPLSRLLDGNEALLPIEEFRRLALDALGGQSRLSARTAPEVVIMSPAIPGLVEELPAHETCAGVPETLGKTLPIEAVSLLVPERHTAKKDTRAL